MRSILRSVLSVTILVALHGAAASADSPSLHLRTPLTVTAAATGGNVRFLSEGACEIRVQILTETAEPFFDSSWKDGNVVDWPVETPGRPLTSGAYRCLVTAKGLDGVETSREATIIAKSGQVLVEPRDGVEQIAIAGAGGTNPKLILLAHDGQHGSIVSTSGDLIFRFGNFLAATDLERMRLTAGGNLGIGTDKPQAPLDVNGMIRTSKGIQFADGTVLTTASGLSAAFHGDPTIPPGSRTANVIPSAVRAHSGSALTGPTLSGLTPHIATVNAQFRADSTGVHIGVGGLDVAGTVTLPNPGIIMMGNATYAHNTGFSNSFVGIGAGNLTTSGTGYNAGFGDEALHSVSTGGGNTAAGSETLYSNQTGSNNTAIGAFALTINTASNNTAIGSGAMDSNQSGSENTATGALAMYENSSGIANTADGYGALRSAASGTSYNTAVGHEALYSNHGGSNTALGAEALYANVSGSSNIAVGIGAGINLTTGSHNIYLDNSGTSSESGFIRIGTSGTQTRAFIAGIRGVTTVGSAIPVLIDTNGQLGTASSSRRYKFDIANIGDTTDNLMRLRPVTFRYRAQGDAAPIQYGLIAEEVADVYPELVARNKDGEVETVMYQFLAPMLLNEVQAQHRSIAEQEKAIEKLRVMRAQQQKTIDSLETALDAITRRLEQLEREHEAGNK